MVGRALARALVAALLASPALAQQVRWSDPGALGAGQSATLELVFEDCSPAGEVQLPRVPGLEITGAPSESRQFTMLNFRASSSTTLGYPVRVARRGRIAIPAFEVDTSEGRLPVAELELEVGEPRLGPRGPALEDVVSARLRVEQRRPYAGEVFPVQLLIDARGAAQLRRLGTPRWEGAGVAAEPFGERGVQPARGGGRSYLFSTLAMVPVAGRIELPPAQIDLELSTGRRTSLFFSEQVQLQLESDAPELEVRPLPAPAPPAFSGAVGNFALESTLVPDSVRVGEPITWTLRLTGEGNWPAGVRFPPRTLPQQLRVVQPKAERHFAEGELFQGSLSEDLVLIPTEAGELALPPLRFAYFDPHAERYRELEIAPPRVRVLPPAAAPAAQSPAPQAGAAGPLRAPARPGEADAAPAPAARERGADAVAPELPELRRLPGAGDEPLLPGPAPIPGRGRGLAPLAAPAARGLALAPLAALATLWLGLALGRAAARDPGRAQRDACRELERRIRDVELASRAASACAPALLAWQHTARAALGAGAGAPGFPREAAQRALGAFAALELDAWAALWAEADALLYGGSALAAGWCLRARSAAGQLRPPRFNPLRALEPQHLFARGAAAALLLLAGAALAAGSARADSGGARPGDGARALESSGAADPLLDAYREADFERATAGFLRRAQRDPGDWIARANLGLSLGQQGRGHEALAHTLAAFLRAPRRSELRWNLRVFARAAGAVEPALHALALGLGAGRLARLASPAEWQLGLAAGSALACLGAGLLLQRRFRGARPRGQIGWPGAALAAGLALAALAGAALERYGALADPAAALLIEAAPLRSIPTEASDEGVSRPLEPGSLVRVRADFLGWRRIERESGEQGWLRRELLVPLYAPLPEPDAGAPAAAPSESARLPGALAKKRARQRSCQAGSASRAWNPRCPPRAGSSGVSAGFAAQSTAR